jgi:hypothetical protein
MKTLKTILIAFTFPIWAVPFAIYFSIRMAYEITHDFLYDHYTT